MSKSAFYLHDVTVHRYLPWIISFPSLFPLTMSVATSRQRGVLLENTHGRAPYCRGIPDLALRAHTDKEECRPGEQSPPALGGNDLNASEP